MIRTKFEKVKPYKTKDSTLIRELLHPGVHGGGSVSLAQASLCPGARSDLHKHALTEEIYHFTGGRGRMTLGGESFDVDMGDTVFIPKGVQHQIENTGSQDMVLLCICTPPYSHDDTLLLNQDE